VQDLGGRVVIGLGVIVAAVVALGYVFVYLGIATPPGGDLGTLAVPPAGDVLAARLDDGRPVYVSNIGDEVHVVDARAPHSGGEVAPLLAWCVAGGTFLDLAGGRSYGADGARLVEGGGTGLTLYRTRPDEDATRVIVEAEAGSAGAAGGDADTAAPGCPANSAWVIHTPEEFEIFDPSVAADEEPPGWIWLEGTLGVTDGEARLCDGLGVGCATWAPVTGIDPATDPSVEGRFIGRVRDGAVEDLVVVPDLGGSG
jgi:hypothetical protein